MKEIQYFLNKGKSCSPQIPSRFTNYLDKNKFLSEFNTEQAKQQVRDNLGISDLLLILKQIVDAKVIEIGGVGWDTEPTEGNTESVLSSDALSKTFAKYILSSELERLLDELSSDYNTKIENIEKKLNSVPVNRGEYVDGERYYKGNLVQYKRGTYIADPVDYDIDTNPFVYVTEAPYDNNPEVLNQGWKVFAKGFNAESGDLIESEEVFDKHFNKKQNTINVELSEKIQQLIKTIECDSNNNLQFKDGDGNIVYSLDLSLTGGTVNDIISNNEQIIIKYNGEQPDLVLNIFDKNNYYTKEQIDNLQEHSWVISQNSLDNLLRETGFLTEQN